MNAEQLAEHFHATLVALAPSFGHKPLQGDAPPWSSVPANDKQLMIAVCSEMLKLLEAEKETKSWEQDMADMVQIAREWHQYRLAGDESPLAPPSKLNLSYEEIEEQIQVLRAEEDGDLSL